ncbi:hypothetical protein BLNAU_7458 [Blattamonas nauphoetae]|uniref:Uncharacterized protein n=1 Tax=Blattamonas nauphoetae TaxID=2049346 RepID=A0ABQ9Y1J0_9EUKA|nr:hypothetical protein BLNAU_7458 [Blattamonas nauphoetae]
MMVLLSSANQVVTTTTMSCLTFFEYDHSIFSFLYFLVDAQLEWNEEGGKVREMGKEVYRMLRMEGIEDLNEAKLQNDKNGSIGGLFVEKSIGLNNLQGMNLS